MNSQGILWFVLCVNETVAPSFPTDFFKYHQMYYFSPSTVRQLTIELSSRN